MSYQISIPNIDQTLMGGVCLGIIYDCNTERFTPVMRNCHYVIQTGTVNYTLVIKNLLCDNEILTPIKPGMNSYPRANV